MNFDETLKNSTHAEDETTDSKVTDKIDRSNLIAAATVFLKSKKIRNSLPHLKRTFLEKKGLTSDEIDMAFKLSESLPTEQNPAYLSEGFIPPASEESWFKKVRRFVMSTVAFTGTALAVFEVFQRYISPWLNGENRDWQERLLEGQAEINENIASLLSTVNDLRKQVAKSSEEKNNHNGNQTADEIKEDLKTLKSIMLGRNQFPTTPLQTRPVLPSWQMENKVGSVRSDLEMTDGKHSEAAMKEILVKNKAEYCNGSAGDDVNDLCDIMKEDDDDYREEMTA